MMSSSNKRILKAKDQEDLSENVKNYVINEVKTGSHKNGNTNNNQKAEEKKEQETKRLKLIRENAYQTGFDEGKRDGYGEGYAEGKNLATSQIEKKVVHISEIISQLAQIGNVISQDLEKELLFISLKIASKIIKKEVQQDEEVILNVVKAAINSAYNKDGLNIRLNPSDVATLNMGKTKLGITDMKDVNLINDDSIHRGGCLIETNYGDIDARINSQIKEVEEELRHWI